MDPATVTLLLAGARQAMIMGISLAEAAGKNEEEIEAFYQESKAEFKTKRPEYLPPPPE